MNKHTPGPWRVVKHDNLVVADDDRMTIMCNFPYSLSVQQNMTDARLIAAAPELLEALQAILDTFIQHHNHPAHVAARMAIRKATGE